MLETLNCENGHIFQRRKRPRRKVRSNGGRYRPSKYLQPTDAWESHRK